MTLTKALVQGQLVEQGEEDFDVGSLAPQPQTLYTTPSFIFIRIIIKVFRLPALSPHPAHREPKVSAALPILTDFSQVIVPSECLTLQFLLWFECVPKVHTVEI